MPKPADKPTQERWEEFLDQYGYEKSIVSIASSYPDRRSLYVDYSDLEDFDTDFADRLLKTPEPVLEAGGAVVMSIARMAQTLGEEGGKIHLRIKGIPPDLMVEVRDIRSKHMSQFISVEGLVRKANEVRPRVQMAAFRCRRCGHITYQEQDSPILKEPLECHKDEDGGGGCGMKAGTTRFDLVKDLSVFIDTEKIEIQEQPEALSGGAQPQTITAYLEDDIAGQVFPGARVIINGVLDSRARQRGNQQQTTFDIFIKVNSVDFVDADQVDIEITDEEMAQIREMASDPEVVERIRDSISPTIYGNEFEKEALALQLFGGVPKEMPDGTKIRGDIHVLLVGDPGTAKSQLLRYMSDISPRGIYASGKSTTGAGLTAAAVKDDWSEGRWTLEAGALVLADKGMACVDELDKMSPQDRSSMHEAMEQQTISVAKAGINATLQSRCSILGAANPKWGRFDPEKYVSEQIELPPTLLSRFDLIFPLTDQPDTEEDKRIADHILKSHLIGELMMRSRTLPESDLDPGEQEAIEAGDPYARDGMVRPDLLKKYVHLAKKEIFPVLTAEAIEKLKGYYLEIRHAVEDKRTRMVPITARQLEGFVRVAEASARARMSQRVELEDAERAIRIVKEYLTRVIGRGQEDALAWDADSLLTGVPSSQQDRRIAMNDIMRKLMKQDSQGFTLGDVMEAATADPYNIDEKQVTTIWREMHRNGEIYQSGKRDKADLYRLVGGAYEML